MGMEWGTSSFAATHIMRRKCRVLYYGFLCDSDVRGVIVVVISKRAYILKYISQVTNAHRGIFSLELAAASDIGYTPYI